jgi:ankyrin repeat protein
MGKRTAVWLLLVAAQAGWAAETVRRPPGAAQIMDACMRVELPNALQRLGQPSIRTREDAGIFAHGLCQLVLQICTAAPDGDECQRPLSAYGLGDAAYTPSPEASLYDAAQLGATATVAELLAAGARTNWQNTGGWTALMIAAAEKHADTVAVLLAAKADPNVRNFYGRTALMYAASYGQDAIVEQLLAAGADPNKVPTDQTGWTALVAAAARGNTSTVELLLRRGADPSIKTRDGMTALEIAVEQGHAAAARLLRAAAAARN